MAVGFFFWVVLILSWSEPGLGLGLGFALHVCFFGGWEGKTFLRRGVVELLNRTIIWWDCGITRYPS